MRWNLRTRKFGYTFFMMLSNTQPLEGVTSLLKNGKHIIMFDLEGCSLEEAKETLMKVQISYNLSDIFIVSDKERSYRAWCFKPVDLKTYLKILLDTDYVDWNFFYYTVKRKKATLRLSSKKNRPKQDVVFVLKSYSVSTIPERIPEKVVYDTGIEKRGISILLGD